MSPPATIRERAPAKINLSLHVIGRRGDGYHLLDSLVAFADVGDSLQIFPADRLSLSISGPFAKGLRGQEADNLVMRAARWFAGEANGRIHLTKSLPVAAGLGGGSADAAATIRGLARHLKHPLPMPEATLGLGADVPVCLRPAPARILGVGDSMQAVHCLPPLPVTLVNPSVPMPTARVFEAGPRIRANGGPGPLPSGTMTVDDAVRWLSRLANDLEPVAMRLEPSILEVADALRSAGAGLARMTGSGATCFGIFRSRAAARAAASMIRTARPNWWVRPTILNTAE
ncbi:MAG: 4-(cytidine 5'-diphospho)-2-C-methyl-D-erythritol kinase [Paracoccaceae bacterium]|nr:4-(cytidine 5'-diphospho)-2-C-methyl-D-erythritol kinase [Paracoccaceae bacterium]